MAKPKPFHTSRKLAIETSPTGFDGVDDALIKAAVVQFRHLLCANFTRFKNVAIDSKGEKGSLSVSVKFCFAGKNPTVGTRASFSQRHADETETETVEDPNQLPLPMDGGAE
jgi:hypothetical protein